ncbi:hypothetical protein M2281_001630 [Mesorhizobium soli]|uniref:hypothetical protein n=1 Tax=Pseudaminobacter soli (ex Li et al. 2025) TaxID=1295366 RepID=UPI0024759D7A|nr:hypothetical protein [Mesorhizobium soli]MDH6231058.1 hypothetical protein [Mesorhizobium soli]
MRHRGAALAAVAGLWATAAFGQQTFGGNECTDDCSGHKAGYEWAEQNSITDPADCNGYSSSFNEGCETFIDEPYRGADEDDDGNEID